MQGYPLQDLRRFRQRLLTMNEPLPAHEDAFRRVLAHRTMLKAYVQAIVRDPVLAEDTFSDVTFEIARSSHQNDPTRPFQRWARGVARRIALEEIYASKTAGSAIAQPSMATSPQSRPGSSTRETRPPPGCPNRSVAYIWRAFELKDPPVTIEAATVDGKGTLPAGRAGRWMSRRALESGSRPL
jgi:hypothetical protein